MRTPATTARRDIRKILNARRSRKQAIQDQAQEIARQKAVDEDLGALYNTDPQQALDRYKVLVQESMEQATVANPPVAASTEDNMKLRRAKALRSNKKYWRGVGKEQFNQQLSESADTVRSEITKGQELIHWLRGCVPTVAEFTGVEGKTVISDDDVVTRANATFQIADLYNSLNNRFNIIIESWESIVEDYEDELDIYETEPLSDIVDACGDLGLEQVYEGSDDGCLWFQDPNNTDNVYFINIIPRMIAVGGKLNILDSARVWSENRNHSQWSDKWDLDLTSFGIIWLNNYPRDFARICRNYGTMYDSLRSWIARSIEAGNEPPSHFPASLTTTK